MKKAILSALCGLLVALTGSAQTVIEDRAPFAKDKVYLSASTSALGLDYTKASDWHFGFNAKGGYLFEDNWMLTANIDYDFQNKGNNSFGAGAGIRYYIEQNGLFLGLGANYKHQHNYDDVLPTAQIGYSYFLNRTVTIEPELYYNQSLKNHSDFSGFGFRIGIGIYFE